MLLQGDCNSDGISEARTSACALSLAIDVRLALTRRLEAPCAAEKGGESFEWLYLDVEHLPHASQCMHLTAILTKPP